MTMDEKEFLERWKRVRSGEAKVKDGMYAQCVDMTEEDKEIMARELDELYGHP